MSPRRVAPLFLFFTLSACSEADPAAQGGVIVGVTTDLRVGVDITRLDLVLSDDGTVLRQESLTSDASTLELPLELAAKDREAGHRIEAKLEGFTGSASLPIVTRSIATLVPAERTVLFRAALDSTCVVHPGQDTSFCDEGLTCIGGACVDPFVDARLLEDYAPDWADAGKGDICKPVGAGAPEVIVGKGQGDYYPAEDGEVAQIEAGPQGGHHIWVAVRQKNLARSGSITRVSGTVLDTSEEFTPFSVVFTYDPDEGGYCKVYGLRFQLDDQLPIEELFGKTVDVRVKISDPDGDIGEGVRRFKLSTDTI